eukprot:4984028-Prymnesium_polylepis.1
MGRLCRAGWAGWQRGTHCRESLRRGWAWIAARPRCRPCSRPLCARGLRGGPSRSGCHPHARS